MKVLYIIIAIFASQASCAGAPTPSDVQIKETHFSTEARFDRGGFEIQFPVLNRDGNTAFQISCYSLGDEAREEFATRTGSDPVADLSCYVKDVNVVNEYTILGLNGESLQFTPAFFWLSDMNRCTTDSYRLTAFLRGINISFIFSHIDFEKKIANLQISVYPMEAASNNKLTEQSFHIGCA